MRTGTGKYEIDMCSGPLPGKVVQFSLPLVLTGILQLLYNAADVIVVGRFAGKTALAAVGSTGSLIALIVNLFIGLSVGASVTTARRYGAGDEAGVSRALHTAVALSVISGLVVSAFGVVMSRRMLQWMASPEDVIDQAALYLRIYFLGIPASMIYNYCAAVLRAIGDTKRPLYYLTISGLVNVALNLLLVIVFHLGVAGVAIATAASQLISAALVVSCLLRSEGCIHLTLRHIRLSRGELTEILRIGVPAGLQSSLFSISNVLIQSSINAFGSSVMAGNAASGNLEGFVYTSMNSVAQAALSFTGQNIGAKRYDRLRRITATCCLMTSAVGVVMGGGICLLSPWLLRLYTAEDAVIQIGRVRLLWVALPYLACGIMDTLAYSLRGSGYSVTPMIVSLLGACGFRVLWIFTVFAHWHELPVLYVSYPISWVLTALAHLICLQIVWRKMPLNGSAGAEPRTD